jgi:hypothetical protein
MIELGPPESDVEYGRPSVVARATLHCGFDHLGGEAGTPGAG